MSKNRMIYRQWRTIVAKPPPIGKGFPETSRENRHVETRPRTVARGAGRHSRTMRTSTAAVTPSAVEQEIL